MSFDGIGAWSLHVVPFIKYTSIILTPEFTVIGFGTFLPLNASLTM